MRITFFIDFDGTITKQDTCHSMTKAFARGDWEAIEKRWEQGQLTTVECARETFRLFDSNKNKLKQFLLNIEIDPYFIPFVNLCRQKGFEIYILSDGYDFNIKTIFEKYGITGIPFFSNELIINEDNSFDIKATYASLNCTRCGTCKTEIFERLKKPDALSVYIGDGISDTCAAQKADKIFAKGKLLKYCMNNDIKAQAFKDFSEIIKWCESLS